MYSKLNLVKTKYGENMKHEINVSPEYHTNLVDEMLNKKINTDKSITVSKSKLKENISSTIYFKDITDKDNFRLLKDKLKKELQKFILDTNKYLIIGLGNENSTFDSLGPKSVQNILVTYHLKKYNLSQNFKLVAKFAPQVTSYTGLDNYKIIKSIQQKEHFDQIIIIDSLVSNNLDNIAKCIQINDIGIDSKNNYHLYQKSLNAKNLNCSVILIGIPTILETNHLNSIVTVKDLDFFLKRAGQLIGEVINELIHNYSFTNDVPL